MSGRTPLEAARAFQAAWDAHDLEAVLALVTEDCVFDSARARPGGSRIVGRDALREAWRPSFAAPSGVFEVDEHIVDGDRVVQLWRMRTPNGETICPAGKTSIVSRPPLNSATIFASRWADPSITLRAGVHVVGIRQRYFCCAMTAGACRIPVAPVATAPAVAMKLRRCMSPLYLERVSKIVSEQDSDAS